jgi:hypothetical protein
LGAKPGVRQAKTNRAVYVFPVEPDTALRTLDGLGDTPELGQADAAVVGDVGVVEHAVEGVEEPQRVLQETVL